MHCKLYFREYIHLWLVTLFLVVNFVVHAQVQPADGASLNCNAFFIEVPSVATASKYEIKLINATTKKEIYAQSRTTAIWVDNLAFNTSYTWVWRTISDSKQ